MFCLLRYDGFSLFPVLARIRDDETPLPKKLAFTRGQVEITAWRMIFRTLDAVKTQANKF